ncbi:probable G-protein coupled receptor 139 [Scyliorhinus torazame]|uniref:probable G-protein coupled receptor 139 n=1 Tax=Scyliorhinus torazame TaxID=75743 RepID=UPI003B5BFF45
MGQPVIVLIKEIYFPVIATIGVPANMLTIVVLCRGKCGLSKCISFYMLAMATADLLVMIINVMVNHIFSYNFPLSFLSHTPVCKSILYLATVALELSIWFTVSFTIDRFAVICCQKFKAKYCTERTVVVVITIFSVLVVLKNVPFFFAYEPQQIIDNMQWGCRSGVAFFSSPIGATFFWFHITCKVCLPFTLIVLFNSLTSRRIIMASRTRKKLRSDKAEEKSDAEIENRRKSIILLFTVSGTFLLVWLTAVVSFVTTGLITPRSYRGDRTNPDYIASESRNMLKFLSSCLNPWIYAATQRKFREDLKKVLKSPCTLILRCIKKISQST